MSLARAIETGDLSELPSRREEGWRWSDIHGLLRVMPPPSPKASAPAHPGPFAGLAEREIILVNGGDEEVVRIGPGEIQRLALRLVAGIGAHVGRLRLEVADGARLVLLESHESEGEAVVSETDLAISLGEGASLDRIVLTDEADGAISVNRAEVRLSAGSRFDQTLLCAGARRQRLESIVRHPGQGAIVRLDGVILASERRHADITTLVRHEGPGGATDQLVKAAVSGQARGVFQGRVVVERGADGTDAKMGCHALVLSERAEFDAKPELEIFADDVACSHGNTVGALDEEALFYARQRGMGEAEARAFLLAGFLAEPLTRIDPGPVRDRLEAWLAERLESLR
ncbi:MAG: SufB/SufD family protein [Caulobacteraceae bacterium]